MVALLGLAMLTLRTPSANIGPLPAEWMQWVPLPLLRLPEFVFGMALAEVVRRGQGEWLRTSPPLIAAGIVAVMAILPARDAGIVVAILSGWLIFNVAKDSRDTAFKRVMSSRILVLLGTGSYAMYLFAVPVRMGFGAMGLTSTYALLLYPPVLIVIGLATFLLIEQPAALKLKKMTTHRLRPHVGVEDDQVAVGALAVRRLVTRT